MAYDIQDLRSFQDATGIIDTDGESLEQQDALLPNTLAAILNPQEALEAAQRMQRWYRSTAQGVAHSIFGRDGRRIEGRLAYEAMAQED
jgi:hypothetical protein